jgi:hypothetical protein
VVSLKDCSACTEYIKKMKGLEFRVSDMVKERDAARNECNILTQQLA